jgi:hypothetical protein
MIHEITRKLTNQDEPLLILDAPDLFATHRFHISARQSQFLSPKQNQYAGRDAEHRQSGSDRRREFDVK